MKCGSFGGGQSEISSKIASWGGARPNSGGARANSGGARPGAGRKPRLVEDPAPLRVTEPVGIRWYCAETEFRAEYDVFAMLARLGFKAHLPRFIDRTRRDRRFPSASVITLLIPGFVLVQFDRAADEWRRIVAEPGIVRLLGPSSDRPTPARPGEVERLIALGRAGDGVIDDDAAPFPTGRVRVGQMVRIEEGPFTSFPGICTWSARRRLRILTTLFGRDAEVEMRHDQVSIV